MKQLQARIGDEIDAEPLIALGAEHGCEFTAEELQESAELSDEDLDEMAGGNYVKFVGWYKKFGDQERKRSRFWIPVKSRL